MSDGDSLATRLDDRPAYEAWRRQVEEETGAGGLAGLRVETLEGWPLEPLYAAAAPDGYAAAARAAGLPGERPFTRGSTRGRAGGWLRCARYDGADGAALHREIRTDLANGIDGIWLDLAGAGEGEASPRDAAALGRALEGVRLDAVTLLVDAGSRALPAAALALAVCRARGAEAAKLRLHFEADPLAAVAREGLAPAAVETIESEAATLAVYASRHLPASRVYAISSEAYHEAGACAARELGFALASAVQTLRRLAEAGLEPAAAARLIGFRVPIGRDVFLAICKQRALRLAWDRVLEACGVDQPPAPWIHAVTSRRSSTRRAPWTNLLRATTALFAAAAGGADAVTCQPHDAARGAPTPLGRRLARNAQAVLAEESHLGRVMDPAGGSYFAEALTRDLARAAWQVLQEVERRGGMGHYLASGSARAAVDEDWRRRRWRIADRSLPVTGVSWFAEVEEGGSRSADETRRSAPPAPGDAEGAVAGYRTSRRPAPAQPAVLVEERIEELVEAAARGAGLDGLALELRGAALATAGPPWPRRRDAAPFERLQDRADELAAASGRPAVWLVGLGAPRLHRSRAEFARRALRAGGFAVESRALADVTPASLAALRAEAADQPGVRAVCLCGPDAAYQGLGEAAQPNGSRVPLLAVGDGGEPPPGVDHWLAPGCDLEALLAGLLGVPAGEDGA